MQTIWPFVKYHDCRNVNKCYLFCNTIETLRFISKTSVIEYLYYILRFIHETVIKLLSIFLIFSIWYFKKMNKRREAALDISFAPKSSKYWWWLVRKSLYFISLTNVRCWENNIGGRCAGQMWNRSRRKTIFVKFAVRSNEYYREFRILEITEDENYKVGTKYVVLNNFYSRNQKQPCKTQFLSINDVPRTTLTLRTENKLESKKGEQGFIRCNCRKVCNINLWVCKKKTM